MATFVSYLMTNDAGSDIAPVGAYNKDIDASVFSSFETEIQKVYPKFHVMLEKLPIYKEEQLSNNCVILFGVYDSKDKDEKPLAPQAKLIVKNYETIDKDCLAAFANLGQAKPKDVKPMKDVIVDPPFEKILTKEYVDELFRKL